jgi:hypothetical protein
MDLKKRKNETENRYLINNELNGANTYPVRVSL